MTIKKIYKKQKSKLAKFLALILIIIPLAVLFLISKTPWANLFILAITGLVLLLIPIAGIPLFFFERYVITNEGIFIEYPYSIYKHFISQKIRFSDIEKIYLLEKWNCFGKRYRLVMVKKRGPWTYEVKEGNIIFLNPENPEAFVDDVKQYMLY